MWFSIRKRRRRPTVDGSLHSIKNEESLIQAFRYDILIKVCCHAITETNHTKNEAEERIDPDTYWRFVKRL
jgi:hypothetical protein